MAIRNSAADLPDDERDLYFDAVLELKKKVRQRIINQRLRSVRCRSLGGGNVGVRVLRPGGSTGKRRSRLGDRSGPGHKRSTRRFGVPSLASGIPPAL